jgi:hypothetical protein
LRRSIPHLCPFEIVVREEDPAVFIYDVLHQLRRIINNECGEDENTHSFSKNIIYILSKKRRSFNKKDLRAVFASLPFGGYGDLVNMGYQNFNVFISVTFELVSSLGARR